MDPSMMAVMFFGLVLIALWTRKEKRPEEP